MDKVIKYFSACIAGYIASFCIPVPYSLALNLIFTAPMLYLCVRELRR